jgi:hypothetical protein
MRGASSAPLATGLASQCGGPPFFLSKVGSAWGSYYFILAILLGFSYIRYGGTNYPQFY